MPNIMSFNLVSVLYRYYTYTIEAYYEALIDGILFYSLDPPSLKLRRGLRSDQD